MQVRHRIRLAQIGVAVAIATIWEIGGRSSPTFFFLLGTPSAALSELGQLIWHQALLSHFLVTGAEALAGLCLGTILGSAFGLLLWYSETTAIIAKPFVVALGTLPVFAFAPLMIVWFGIGLKMKVALAMFSTVFVAFNQAHRGATNVSSDYVDVLKGMNASRNQIFIKVIVPGSIDWVLSSMRLNVGFGLLGAFIGEFIAADRGLGFLILRAASLYNIPRVMAAAAGITLLALLLDRAAQSIERRRHLIVQWLSVPRVLRKKS